MKPYQYMLLIAITVFVCINWSQTPNSPSTLVVTDKSLSPRVGIPQMAQTTAPEPPKSPPPISRQKPTANKTSPLGYISRHGELPTSLKGTGVDSILSVDKHGRLIITQDIKSIFDYFFTTVGEEPIDIIISRIEEYLTFNLAEPALTQSLNILTDYTKYLNALENLSDKGASSTSLGFQQDKDSLIHIKNKLEQLKDLRRKHLPIEVTDAFFSEDEAYDTFTIERLLIEQEPNISQTQQQNLMAQLESQLPPSIIETRNTITKPVRLIQETQKLRARGGSDEDIRSLRETMYNEEVAERLAGLDLKRRLWDKKLKSYQTKKNKIVKNSTLSKAQKIQKIQELLNQQFSKSEQIRVNVIEPINTL